MGTRIDPIDGLYVKLKHSAKKRGIPFDLTKADLGELTVPISCPVLGVPVFAHTGKAEDTSLSIDRIDNTKGYTKDNIIFVSLKANKMKNQYDIKELAMLVEFYQELERATE